MAQKKEADALSSRRQYTSRITRVQTYPATEWMDGSVWIADGTDYPAELGRQGFVNDLYHIALTANKRLLNDPSETHGFSLSTSLAKDLAPDEIAFQFKKVPFDQIRKSCLPKVYVGQGKMYRPSASEVRTRLHFQAADQVPTSAPAVPTGVPDPRDHQVGTVLTLPDGTEVVRPPLLGGWAKTASPFWQAAQPRADWYATNELTDEIAGDLTDYEWVYAGIPDDMLNDGMVWA